MSSLSYWQSSLGLPNTLTIAAAVDTLECDLCIVGGGIAGSSATHWAAARGLRTVLLEAREAAMGATGRNAGFVLSGVADNYYRATVKYGRENARELWQLSIENRSLMLDLAEALDVPCWRIGSLVLAESEEESDELRRSAALLAADGFAGDYEADALRERGFFGGLRRPDDGTTQPAALSRALLAQSGATVLEGTALRGWQSDGAGVVVRSDRATVRAKWLFLATNAWSARIHRYFHGKVSPMRGQIYLTDPAPLLFDTAGYSHHGYYYFRQVPEADDPTRGRWLLGGARHLNFDSENHVYDESIGDKVQRDLEAWSAAHFPEFADLPISHRWAGLMAFTPDGQPLVGTLPDEPRVGFAVGFNGHGMGLGILVVRQALNLVLDGRPAPRFDARRFDA